MIGVYSGRGLAAMLREKCPDLTFLDAGEERERCRIAIIDTEVPEEVPPRKKLIRVILTKETPVERRQGELRVDPETFLRTPGEYLRFASDMVDAVIHAAQLEVEVQYLEQIHELMSMSDADAVSARITRTVLDLLGLSRGTLYLHDPRLERYVVSYSSDPDARETGEFLPGIPSDLLQRSLASQQPFAADAAMGLAVMPLRLDDDLIGVIRVPTPKGVVFRQDAIEAVARYVRAVASVVSNIYQLTQSRDLAMRDDLTKAYNRRFFETYLDEEIERARRYGSLFSIIFLDMDDLKSVNNVHGHLTGSRTLQEVAKRVLGAVRAIDKVIRFGGDEFCIVLPQTDQQQAVAVANRVRRSLTASPLHVDELEIAITASFGIASYPTHGLTKDDLIRQADGAMYRIKSTTKNAVGVATIVKEQASA